MLVIIKSSPHTDEAKRGLQIAKDTSSDIALIQNGVYFSSQGGLEEFKGRAYCLDEDMRLRGVEEAKNITTINYAGLVDLMTGVKTVGMF